MPSGPPLTSLLSQNLFGFTDLMLNLASDLTANPKPVVQTSGAKTAFHEFPIYNFPKRFQISGPIIPIINVVGVLPDITRQKRDLIAFLRHVRVARVYNGKLIIAFDKPRPARTKVGQGGFCKILLELCRRLTRTNSSSEASR